MGMDEASIGTLRRLFSGYLRGQSAADPEDLIGEVFLQVVRGLECFDGGKREFRAWVFAVARHRLIDDGVGGPAGPRRGATRLRPEEARAWATVEEEVLPGRRGRPRPPDHRAAFADQRDVLLLRCSDLTVDQAAKALGKRRGR